MARNRAGGKCQGSGTEVGKDGRPNTRIRSPKLEVRSQKSPGIGHWVLGTRVWIHQGW